MMKPKFGDLTIARVPFSDFTSHRRRPVIVISATAFNQSQSDALVVPLTSQPEAARVNALYIPHWEELGLSLPSWIKPAITTVHQSRLVEKLGEVDPPFLREIFLFLSSFLGGDGLFIEPPSQ